MRTTGRTYIVTYFSREKTAQRYLEILEDVRNRHISLQ